MPDDAGRPDPDEEARAAVTAYVEASEARLRAALHDPVFVHHVWEWAEALAMTSTALAAVGVPDDSRRWTLSVLMRGAPPEPADRSRIGDSRRQMRDAAAAATMPPDQSDQTD